MLVSDASGDDGFGGVIGDIHDPNPKVFSQQWPTGVLPKSSFVGELAALRFHLSQRVHAARTSVELTTPPRLLLWVTDNQGAALSIDSGTSHKADGRSNFCMRSSNWPAIYILHLLLYGILVKLINLLTIFPILLLLFTAQATKVEPQTFARQAAEQRLANTRRANERHSLDSIVFKRTAISTTRQSAPIIRDSGGLSNQLPASEQQSYGVPKRYHIQPTMPLSQP